MYTFRNPGQEGLKKKTASGRMCVCGPALILPHALCSVQTASWLVTGFVRKIGKICPTEDNTTQPKDGLHKSSNSEKQILICNHTHRCVCICRIRLSARERLRVSCQFSMVRRSLPEVLSPILTRTGNRRHQCDTGTCTLARIECAEDRRKKTKLNNNNKMKTPPHLSTQKGRY